LLKGDVAFKGYKVVAAYPQGILDIVSSTERIPGYTEEVKKMGVEIVNSIADLLEKIKQTNIQKYGVDSWSKTTEGRLILSSRNSMKNPEIARLSRVNRLLKTSHINDEFKDILLNHPEQFKTYIDSLGLTFRKEIADHIGISQSWLNALFRACDMANEYLNHSHGSSYKEKELIDFINSLGIKFKLKDRTILEGKELDILIPESNLAIEFNGLYYHSEFTGGKDKYYHVDKTNLAESKGIQLLHIFEYEWDDEVKQKIWNSIIKSKLADGSEVYTSNSQKIRNSRAIPIEGPTTQFQIPRTNNSSGSAFTGGLEVPFSDTAISLKMLIAMQFFGISSLLLAFVHEYCHEIGASTREGLHLNFYAITLVERYLPKSIIYCAYRNKINKTVSSDNLNSMYGEHMADFLGVLFVDRYIKDLEPNIKYQEVLCSTTAFNSGNNIIEAGHPPYSLRRNLILISKNIHDVLKENMPDYDTERSKSQNITCDGWNPTGRRLGGFKKSRKNRKGSRV
jgi:hypothetical protein